MIKKDRVKKEMNDNLFTFSSMLGKIADDTEDGNVMYICDECVRNMRKLYAESDLDPEVGDEVKVHFEGPEDKNEQMWVEITAVQGDSFKGILHNQPEILNMKWGDTVEFEEENILMCMPKSWEDERKNQYIMEVHRRVSEMHEEHKD